ncbi:hypothetical protein SISNIDRAFT_408166 [Sistotremastrum niveocremeum HHB9708]|uniref:CHCH domain-containing protein n=1 Tax=Sistotremastrum niveocremeum HHB9708 TaxID=1314777 RepID=A0A164XPV6_9AGAM|nr:hypothetical protein SISNIDRAFT_408166 [Sistotremastrum niveocremeum HHB9708]
MSFGRPPTFSTFQPNPPDRGAFPLDHEGECKDQMMRYLSCLKLNSNSSTPCRVESKTYLDCRMNKGLMQKEDWKNLGLNNVGPESTGAKGTVEEREG